MSTLRSKPDEKVAPGRGTSEGDRGFGFHPAFLDFDTQTIHPARFADGRPAPFHILDGLPGEVVIDRLASGRAVAVKATLIAGYVRNGFFYTRSAAARAMADWGFPARDRSRQFMTIL